ncbi:MAG: hypothetical protein KDA80_09940 [Planctomycetaceae bacterium]|nr:hypothetical protein [Planctomycetaceae bacterium]
MSQSPDIDDELYDLEDRARMLSVQSQHTASKRLFDELRRRAKSEQRILPYLHALFFQMIEAENVLQIEEMREHAIELIPLLQEEEAAREIQPDLPEEGYFATTYWMTPCVFEHLAEATGLLNGYNSPGMQQCISEGLQVCRNVGKLLCQNCFKEYSIDVYMAADDFEMARYQCNHILSFEGEWPERGDHRFQAMSKLARMSMLEGQLGLADLQWTKARELAMNAAEGKNEEACRLTAIDRITNLLLLQQPIPEELQQAVNELPTREEWPYIHRLLDLNAALEATVNGELESAQKILVEWDQRLRRDRQYSYWFETRLRLMAVVRMQGNDKQAERLGRELLDQARMSNDWLTVRRAERLLDFDIPPTPIAALAELRSDPPTERQVESLMSAEAPEVDLDDSEESGPSQIDEETPDTPLKEDLTGFQERFRNAMVEQDEQLLPKLDEILAYDASRVTDWQDAAMLVHLVNLGLLDPSRASELWRWADSLMKLFPEEGTLLSVVATLGFYLRDAEAEGIDQQVSDEEIGELFEKSLRLAGHRARNFQRAGDYYISKNDLDSAERCYSRGFRLDRKNGEIAFGLAQIYYMTGRPRDALHVLDLSLRRGADDLRVMWRAAEIADELRHFDAVLTYTDDIRKELEQPLPKLAYLRAVALHWAGREEDAFQELEAEAEIAGEERLHLDLMQANIFLATDRFVEAEQLIRGPLITTPMSTAEYYPPGQFGRDAHRLLELLYEKCPDSEVATIWENRLLGTAFAPEELFERIRQPGEIADVGLFHVFTKQDLGRPFGELPDSTPDEVEWSDYVIRWGVLAVDEEDAGQRALAMHRRANHPGTSEIVHVFADEDRYQDAAGVVYQAERYPADVLNPEEDEADDLSEG